MRAAKQEEKSQGTQHPIGHHQGYTRDTEHMGGAATFPQPTLFHSYATTTPVTISSETPIPETSQYQYYQQQVCKISNAAKYFYLFMSKISQDIIKGEILIVFNYSIFMFNSKV